jgi:hypothetical protein
LTRGLFLKHSEGANDDSHSATTWALENFLSALATVRKFKDVQYKIVNTPTWLLVKLDLKEAPDFPIIRIGGRGGFEMPDISTHPPPPDNIAKTAFEACLWEKST